MINWKSILSSFNDKPTLLEWLKLVEKALNESVLKDVTINQNGNDITFTFKFEDGTSITTPKVTLPKGDKGDTGESGISLTRFDTIDSIVVGDETLTTIRAHYSNSSFNEFRVYARNGKNATAKLYLHRVTFKFESDAMYVLYIDIPTNTTNAITVDFLRNYIQGYCVVSYNGSQGKGTVTLYCTPNNIEISGSAVDISTVNSVYITYSNANGLAIDSQTLIEL